MNLEPGHHIAEIERTARQILDARARYPEQTLASLYDPETMPGELRAAHAANDRAVDNAYIAAELRAGRPKPRLETEADRVAFLFELHSRLIDRAEPPNTEAKPTREAGSA